MYVQVLSPKGFHLKGYIRENINYILGPNLTA
jgi:hypothetical protein